MICRLVITGDDRCEHRINLPTANGFLRLLQLPACLNYCKLSGVGMAVSTSINTSVMNNNKPGKFSLCMEIFGKEKQGKCLSRYFRKILYAMTGEHEIYG